MKSPSRGRNDLIYIYGITSLNVDLLFDKFTENVLEGQSLNHGGAVETGRNFPPLTVVLGVLFLILGLHAVTIDYLMPYKDDGSDFDSAMGQIENDHIAALNDIRSKLESAEAGADARELEDGLAKLMDGLNALKNRQSMMKVDRVKPKVHIADPAHTYNHDAKIFTKWVNERMKFDYGSSKKVWPYVGSKFSTEFKENSRPWLNSLAVFPETTPTRRHGLIGLNADGTQWYKPKEAPPELKPDTPEEEAAMKRGGGFYLDLSDHLPLDRDVKDFRNDVCREADTKLDIHDMPDAAVIITFYNEPISTLLRSVHSVLNTVPANLLREIILVDDHSSLQDNKAKLDEAVMSLPKTHVLRLPHRHGLVQARLAGIKTAQAGVVVILDSHIEATESWIQPLLGHLKTSPKSLVYPQIPGINPLTFEHDPYRGIGCKLTFKWIMQEQATAVSEHESADAVPSASMAGGLFAVYRDFFWTMGGYDEHMTMWGAENVEMPLRYWQCGARVECMPCSRVHHIYRHKGSGYKSPGDSVKINRLRTAYLWIDEFFQLTKQLMGKEVDDIGPVDEVLALKEKRKCKDFHWFVETLGLDLQPKQLEDVELIGEIRNVESTGICIDSLSKKHAGDGFGTYTCHGQGGSQGWISYGDKKIRNSSHENICMSKSLKFKDCKSGGEEVVWDLDPVNKVIATKSGTDCLGIKDNVLVLRPCGDRKDPNMQWKWSPLMIDPNYQPPRHSEKWIKEHEVIKKRMELP